MVRAHIPLAIHVDKPDPHWIASCTNGGCCRDDSVHLDSSAEALAYARHLVDLAEDGPADNPLQYHRDPAWDYARDWNTHRETRS